MLFWTKSISLKKITCEINKRVSMGTQLLTWLKQIAMLFIYVKKIIIFFYFKRFFIIIIIYGTIILKLLIT